MDMQTLIRRVRGEYLEMPGMSLTLAQACRLWQMDTATCQAALDALIAERFLGRTRDGAFVLAGSAVGHVPRMAKASLRPPSHHAVA
jgi:hypothetical protein